MTKSKMYTIASIKKQNGVNENVAATISHNEYKVVFLNKSYLRHSLNRIQNVIVLF